MTCFDDDKNEAINQMWIHVRCYNIHDVPVGIWALAAAAGAAFIFAVIRKKKNSAIL